MQETGGRSHPRGPGEEPYGCAGLAASSDAGRRARRARLEVSWGEALLRVIEQGADGRALPLLAGDVEGALADHIRLWVAGGSGRARTTSEHREMTLFKGGLKQNEAPHDPCWAGRGA